MNLRVNGHGLELRRGSASALVDALEEETGVRHLNARVGNVSVAAVDGRSIWMRFLDLDGYILNKFKNKF